MDIVTLMDNQIDSDISYKHLVSQHGLSMYIRTKDHHILFDTGQNAKFMDNAKELGVDLQLIDICIISHGHYDHGGGLKAFLKMNKLATVYIHPEAFRTHQVRKGLLFKNIGISKALKDHPQVKLVEGTVEIGPGLTLFQNEVHDFEKPRRNLSLLAKFGTSYKPDPFDHEINLLIEEEQQRILLCGCAHNGIANIMETHKRLFSKHLDLVLGGFHLSRYDLEQVEDRAYIDVLNKQLEAYDVEQYFTCHCTGQVIYDYMKQDNKKIFLTTTGTMLKV